MGADRQSTSPCSIARCLDVLGERWTFLIVREALSGVTRFADFRAALGIAPDVLTERLSTLVAAGVLDKQPYQDPGARVRYGYHLTAAGLELKVILAALQQWGDDHRPYELGPTVIRRATDDRPVRVAFVDDADVVVADADVAMIRTTAYPTRT